MTGSEGGRPSAATVPTFFGPDEQPLFGWLHLPDRLSARAAVVCCPPYGVEASSSHAGLRALADGLARAGFLALRFDYLGTGNSAGVEGAEDRVGAWLESIREAVALVRSCGASAVGLVGLRLGATLAAEAARRDVDVDALVLWDPCARGSGFVREQQVLSAVHLGEPPARAAGQDVEILGAVLSPATAGALAALDLATMPGPLARRVLLVERPERPMPAPVGARLGREALDRCDATEQAAFVDVLPDASVVPSATIDRICAWCAASLGGDPRPVRTEVRDLARVARGPDGWLTERAVGIGPAGLFGVLTEPAGPPSGPTVAFLNAGVIHHVGPARLWVTLARDCAAAGLPALRVDISGIGESPARAGKSPQAVYPIEALEDVGQVVAACTARNPHGVVLAGLCSGAYHAMEAGSMPGVRGVCAINPLLHFDPPELAELGRIAPERRVVRPYPGWMRPFLSHRGFAETVERRSPAALWWALERLHLYANPITALRDLVRRQVVVILLCGDEEALQFTKRGRPELRRLTRTGLVHLEELPGVDHSLFGASARSLAIDAFRAQVVARFAGGPSGPEPAPAGLVCRGAG